MSVIPSGFRALPLSISQLSLDAVLKCGQSFRWLALPLHAPGTTVPLDAHSTHEYRLCLKDRVVCLRQSPDSLFYRTVVPRADGEESECSIAQARRDVETLAFIQDYFQLDLNLLTLYEDWSNRDPVFRELRSRFSGIRMLRQDPWENVVSFICSSNNNIARITKMVQALCRNFSPALVTVPAPAESPASILAEEMQTYHPFPPPSVLAAPSVAATLRTLGFGYRAEYIQRTAQMLVEAHSSDAATDAWLRTLRTMDTADARIELLKFVGVGRKVADCILLMSLDKREVVPVDTHVHQIAVKHYGMRGSSTTKIAMTPKLYDDVNAKLASIWGDYAGWAHSVLFTADLKSFASYGLPTPSPSLSPEKAPRSRPRAITLPTPSPSPRNKKRAAVELKEETMSEVSFDADMEGSLSDGNMADRVKKRRRVTGQRPPLLESKTSRW